MNLNWTLTRKPKNLWWESEHAALMLISTLVCNPDFQTKGWNKKNFMCSPPPINMLSCTTLAEFIVTLTTSTLLQRKGWAPQHARQEGVSQLGGGGVLHTNNNDDFIRPFGLAVALGFKTKSALVCARDGDVPPRCPRHHKLGWSGAGNERGLEWTCKTFHGARNGQINGRMNARTLVCVIAVFVPGSLRYCGTQVFAPLQGWRWSVSPLRKAWYWRVWRRPDRTQTHTHIPKVQPSWEYCLPSAASSWAHTPYSFSRTLQNHCGSHLQDI